MRRAFAAAATIAGCALLSGAAVGALGATGPAPPAGPAGATGATGASGPIAAGPVIASLTADVPIAAGVGWIVWSVPAAGGYGLEASRAGVARALAVAPRPQPFDVSVGTGTTGHAVLTFSRCSTTPTTPPLGLGAIAPLTGSGCRIHSFDLTTNQEATPAVPHPAATSDTSPAIWHGRIAFARADRVHHQLVQQVLLWTPGRHTLRTLPHGALPAGCPNRGGCAGQTRSGSVQGLAYDGRLVSYLWQPVAPGVFGDAGWEVRADNVASGASRLVSGGFAGEVCTGGDDLDAPSPPVLDGYTVSLVALAANCYVFNSVFAQMNTAAPGNGVYGPLPGVVVGLAEDRGTFYAVEAPVPTSETDPTCSAAAPCQIQQVAQPAPLKPEPRKPSSPFF